MIDDILFMVFLVFMCYYIKKTLEKNERELKEFWIKRDKEEAERRERNHEEFVRREREEQKEQAWRAKEYRRCSQRGTCPNPNCDDNLYTHMEFGASCQQSIYI